LEQIASGPALAQQFNKYSTDRTVTAKEVFNFAAGGNAKALEVLRNASHSLGAGVGWLVNVLDPEAVVIGGGVGLAGGTFWESLVQSTRQHIWSELNRDLPIVPADTGPDAGVIGAAVAWSMNRQK
jgi:glucokinase